MQRKKGISVNAIVLFCEIWTYYSLNARYINFSLFTILRWVFPVLLIGIAALLGKGRIAAPPQLVWWFTMAVIPPSLLGADPVTSIAKYISWVLIFYGSYIYFSQLRSTHGMHRCLNILITVLVIFQLINFVCTVSGVGDDNGRSTGITTNPNTLGVYSNLAFWAGVFWFDHAKNALTKGLWIGFVLTTAYTAVASGSRVAFVVLVINILVFVFYRNQKRRSFILLTIGMAVVGYLILSGKLNFLNIDAIQRLSGKGGTTREALWDAAFSVWNQNKLFGVGYTLSPFYNKMGYGLAFHNSYISFLVECGLWGAVILVLAIVPVLIKIVWNFMRAGIFREHREFNLVCFMLGGLAVTAWSESFMFAVGSTEGFTFWFLLAWVMCYINKEKREK